ncbi:serine protease [Aquiflexum sp. TKW24L]|uniref:trypsin-like serine peptidase n=1 Tax=Aquiflexum sp. TKW24L TaxID=2942212 RepID=UPI0020C14F59|nr:serine protease [Aquiflexum sp. TKW24L]MCL6260962.1 serine protease [Aquiflexum sp. TKW24L]
MKKKVAETAKAENELLESHSAVSNDNDQKVSLESSFQGMSLESVEAESKGTEEMAAGSTESKESGVETSSGQSTELFELDAWYGSYPEDLKEFHEFKSPDALEVIIGADDRTRINPTTAYPWRAICSLLIRTKTGKNYIGTGWFVGPRTVITAGHCIYLHNEGGWPQSVEVIPGRNGSLRPYGSASSSTFRSVTGWTQNKDRNFDYGAIILPLSAKLGNTVGYFGYGIRNDAFLKSLTLNLSGYPGDKDGGSTQWFHSRVTKGVSSRVITYEIDTMGGQSGSPVWYKDGSSRYAVGIHTNGHSSGNSATRIVQAVFDNIQAWKQQGM